jgi:hypothetical protein
LSSSSAISDQARILHRRQTRRRTRLEKKEDTEKGKGLLDPKNGTQSALIYRAVHKAKNPTFAEILAAIAPALKGKAAKTIEANARWYVNDLKKKGLLKASGSKEERVDQ